MGKSIKVLMISSDRRILEEGSAVSERMKEYGNLVEELHIVLLSDASHGLVEKQLSENVRVYPTNSVASFMRPLNAAKIGKRIVFEKKFTRGQSLITADSVECGWAGLKVKRKWRLPLELQLHTDPFSPYFKGFQNAVRRLIIRKVLRQADGVRVVTSNLTSRISGLTQARIYILPIYVDVKKIEEPGVSFDLHARYGWRFIMLTVSRLSPEKNLPFALEVLARVREKYPDIGLVIVGSGPEESKLRRLVKKLKLRDAVEFAGWQSDPGSFYKTANVFLQTSHFEGYGLALIEAGLSGLPVVTTPVGIANELEHGKDAYIFQHGDLDAFAGGVADLLENNFKRDNLRVNMKHALETKLLTKEDYMAKIKDNWEKLVVVQK